MKRVIFAAFLFSMFGSSCAPLMGSLRRDLDDSDYSMSSAPVTGGQWSERGFLSESMGESGYGRGRYEALGQSDRAPASLSGGTDPRDTLSGASWQSESRMDANRRDGVRGSDVEEEGGPTFSSTPYLQPKDKRQYKNGMRATRADFLDESQNEGSLWASDGQTNYYFTKNKIRGIGDIVTISLDDEMVRDFGLEIRRNLTPLERGKELALAQQRLRAKALGQQDSKDSINSGAAAPDRTEGAENRGGDRKPANVEAFEVPTATLSDIDVARSMEIKAGDTMMAEIMERYPNGNYKIRGTKKVAYKNGSPRVMTLLGVVRSSDIGEDDVVNSGKLYEYRLEALR